MYQKTGAENHVLSSSQQMHRLEYRWPMLAVIIIQMSLSSRHEQQPIVGPSSRLEAHDRSCRCINWVAVKELTLR